MKFERSLSALTLTLVVPALAHAQMPATADGLPTDALVEPARTASASVEPVEPVERVERVQDWTDHLTYGIFADAFYMVDWNRPDIATAATAAPHRGYEYTDGFGLAFAGVDARYASDHWEATVSLRYGVGAQRYLVGGLQTATDPLDPTTVSNPTGGSVPALSALKQAYGSIVPTEELTIDVGLFDTIYGAEVADSWVNANYSRSPLNYLMQPFYHLGVRATYEVSDRLVVKGLVSNATNAYSGLDGGLPYFGAQVGYTSDAINFYVGYMTGQPGVATARTRGEWEHFVDVIASVAIDDFRLVGNVDLWTRPTDGVHPGWGASLVAAYRMSEVFSVAVRGDVIRPSSAYWTAAYDDLVVGTATLDVRPFEDNVILRLEHRFEWADQRTFVDADGTRDTWMSTTVSAVVRTGD